MLSQANKEEREDLNIIHGAGTATVCCAPTGCESALTAADGSWERGNNRSMGVKGGKVQSACYRATSVTKTAATHLESSGGGKNARKRGRRGREEEGERGGGKREKKRQKRRFLSGTGV